MIYLDRYPSVGDWQSPTQDTDLPYDFVPVPLSSPSAPDEILVDRPEPPVWHDGANADQDKLYSGELLCTLRTLSPLLVANQHVAMEGLSEEAHAEIDRAPSVSRGTFASEARAEMLKNIAEINRSESNGQLDANGANRAREKANDDLDSLIKKSRNKTILFPLTLGDDGPVLIPGSSLKGMFRHAYGALLGAPLERVAAANYSQRPNADASPGPRSKACAAQVLRYDKERLELQVALIDNIACIEFVHGTVPTFSGEQAQPGISYGKGSSVEKKRRVLASKPNKPTRYRWIRNGGGQQLGGDYVYLRYHHALDANRYFRRAAGKGSGIDHPGVFVPSAAIDYSAPVWIEPAVVRLYRDTLTEHLQDANGGHLKRIKDNHPEAIVWPELQPGDLIFVEWLLPQNGSAGRVISFGHNFYYRWKSLDTVTTVAKGFDGAGWKSEPRPETTAHPKEAPAHDGGPPAALSTVRGMHGYVVPSTGTGGESVESFGALARLKDPFSRLAGRVSFNIAMERVADGDVEGKRFVKDGGYVFLHPTGEPKPSFAPTHLPGSPASWGGGVLRVMKNGVECFLLQDGGAVFAGRKFYPHQLTWNNGKYAALPSMHYDLDALLREVPSENIGRAWELKTLLWGDQAPIAKRLSKAGRSFGFTVRFKALREWELAALAATLDPRLLIRTIAKTPANKFTQAKAYLTQMGQGRALGLGHKLGYGRAMGLGSVQIHIDDCISWSGPCAEGAEPDFESLIGIGLLPRLDDATTTQWLRVHQLAPDRPVRPYLLHQGGSILNWSWQTLKQKAQNRRQAGFGDGVTLAGPPEPTNPADESEEAQAESRHKST